ncbi:nSTAND3 domain-containing NTPase [Arsenicibacter rosenii]|uniref:Novel STAND NTPase 3 domain-containing protein n=1 Tax=Arsenicibacter rosenii TaxID=1750698 RepID=A0A1S2VMD6_9BACT|nr:hypothetical protein [Arsenicibacter rosenii]OIN59937.1 hypothetical protein BLX24_08840 [Arsenicibacter rosenii]
MNQRLTDIEEALKQIDHTNFQFLCDEYLYCRYGKDFRQITRTGTQVARIQTVKGTPDTYIVLPTGKYVLIEYTKQEKGLLKKLQEDIDKCLDTNKTSLISTDIDRILLIHTGKLSIEKDKQLRSNCPVTLELIGIDMLALSIHNDFQQLARRYLRINFGSLQLQSPDEFISEQGRKQVDKINPLENPFRGREREVNDALNNLTNFDILVITGSQGLGKTRLALELINSFCEINDGYQPFCIANKYTSLIEDLNSLLLNNGKYVILIDDANRQTPILLETLGNLYARPKIKFKLILTVRDYAFDVVSKHLIEYRWCNIVLERFSNEQLVKLISQKPFNIKNDLLQNRIIDLANGNPRIAVMAALVALKENNIFALNDATSLYNSYYKEKTDTGGEALFENENRTRVLGILSVFRQLDLLYKPLIDKISSVFNVSFNDLTSELNYLQYNEFADMYAEDDSLFRIPDQNLATYAIFYTFIDKKLLSLKSLIDNFFEEYPNKIKDAIYDVLNAFNQKNITDSIKPDLRGYLSSIHNNDNKIFRFIDVFFVVIPLETIQYLIDFNNNLKIIRNEWNTSRKYNFGDFDRDILTPRLNVLFHFFASLNDYFELALELLVEIIKINPDTKAMVISLIEGRLAFRPEDQYYTKLRQTLFFEHIIAEVDNNNESSRKLLYEIIPFFLKSEFRTTTTKGKTLNITTLQFPVRKPFTSFRMLVWDYLYNQFDNYPQDCRAALFSYRLYISKKGDKSLLKFDRRFIIKIIKDKLLKDNFEDCYFVHNYIHSLVVSGSKIGDLEQTNLSFSCSLFSLYKIFNWKLLYGKEIGISRLRYSDEFNSEKRLEILEKIKIVNSDNILALANDIRSLLLTKKCQLYDIERSLGIILKSLHDRDKELFKIGLTVFLTLEEFPLSIHNMICTGFGNVIERPYEWINFFYIDLQQRTDLLLTFFSLISAESIDPVLTGRVLDCFKNQNYDQFYFNYHWWEKYNKKYPHFYANILYTLTNRYEKEGIRYFLREDFIESRIDINAFPDTRIIEKLYLQSLEQFYSKYPEHYDSDGSTLKLLLVQRPDFIFDLINFYYDVLEKDDIGHPDINNLHIIWHLAESHKIIMQVIDLLISKKKLEFAKTKYDTLFKYNGTDFDIEVNLLFKAFVLKYFNNTSEISNIIQALSECKKLREWHYFIYEYVSQKPDINEFECVSWTPTVMSGSNDYSINQGYVDIYTKILNIVLEMPKRLFYVNHIKYLEEKISYYKDQIKKDRRNRFAGDDI